MISGFGAFTARSWDLGALSQTYHFLIKIVSNRMISGLGASTARSWDLGPLSQTDHFLIKILIGCFPGSAPRVYIYVSGSVLLNVCAYIEELVGCNHGYIFVFLCLYIYIYTYIFLCAYINVQIAIVVSKRSVVCTRFVSKYTVV